MSVPRSAAPLPWPRSRRPRKSSPRDDTSARSSSCPTNEPPMPLPGTCGMPHPSGLLNSRVMRSSGEDVNALRGYWETLSEGGAVSVPPREADVGRRVRDVRGPVPDRLDGQHRPTAGLRSVRLAPSGTLATGVDVRGLSSLALASIVGVLAVTLAAGTTTAGAAAPESVSNITNDDFHFSNDEAPGSVGTWLFSVYEQHGLRSRARVVANDDDLVQVDGSLRLATPGEGDRIALRHLTSLSLIH